MKTDFEAFKVGTVFNGLERPLDNIQPVADSVTIAYPSRLEAMALDPSQIAANNNLIYPAGQIDFSVALTKLIQVERTARSDISVSERTARQPLVRHAASITRQALGVEDGLSIDVDASLDLRHCGLGSSSSLVAGVAATINELYGKPIGPLELSRYVAQNHGEEIDGETDQLMPVQCIGGSAICGHFDGSLVVLAGQATPIFRMNLPETKQVVIGIPNDYTHPDSQTLMNAEVDNMAGFKNTGETHGPAIAYRLVHEVLPGLVAGRLKPCKDLIFDYRWDMGSIANCAFVYPPLTALAEDLRPLKDDPAIDILSLSSVGPGFFAVTEDPAYVEDIFSSLDMSVHHATMHNNPYAVIEKR